MIAGDTTSVAELNRRARADRVAASAVSQHGVETAAGQTIGVGDLVRTRQNNRRLTAGGGWVKNGDEWVVTATHDNGSITARPVAGTGEVVLPAPYVGEHVEPAYATTAYRAQGRTVDTAHALIFPTATRELLYVSTTRGRDSNHLYVDTRFDHDPETGHQKTTEPVTAREVLAGVLARESSELSAHQVIDSIGAQNNPPAPMLVGTASPTFLADHPQASPTVDLSPDL